MPPDARNGSSPQARGTHDWRFWARPNQRLIPAGAGNTCPPSCAARSRAAHPRRRGEHSSDIQEGHEDLGSSPQARGTRVHVRRRHGGDRLIPAGAGNTTAPRMWTRQQTAHPRRRGEHPSNSSQDRPSNGSSPQARGTREARGVSHAPHRLIPAGAGNTHPSAPSQRRRSAHPRRRGEHCNASTPATTHSGSSPQARGTRGQRRHRRDPGRLIPAGAGNTSSPPRWAPSSPAHPRRRGEHMRVFSSRHSVAGSSPQARGTQEWTQIVSGVARLIPAGAGNTDEVGGALIAIAAHPRRRGEHSDQRLHCGAGTGSSPQARGTHPECPRRSPLRRLIPAGAGNTGWQIAEHRSHPAHPRRRGEHTAALDASVQSTGSSPQARGTRAGQACHELRQRLIPAGAGNTATMPGSTWTPSAHPRRRGEHVCDPVV